MKTIIITEEQKHNIDLLLEDKEGKNLAKARHYLQSKGYSPEQSQQMVDSIRTDIPNSRLQQCKFILGVARLYLDGQLNDGQAIGTLNKTLKYIASDAHVNEYDYNLNNESLQVLVNRFKGVAKNDLQQSIDTSNARQLTVNQDYTIVPIDSAKKASKYGKYTSWCVTHNANMYNSYTNNGTGRFYFCLKKGFEKEVKVEGEGSPLDNYGLSMIAVSVDMEGAVNTITCRWNHDMGGNDNIMTVEQLEDLLGRNFYQTFKPYTREELHAKGVILFDEVQGLLDSGKKPETVFDSVDGFWEGFARVYLNDKYNFISREGRLLSNQWFDSVGDFRDGFASVQLNDKWNHISIEGRFLSNQWFDYVGDFRDGFAKVYLNDKWNYINKEGQYLSNQWFDIANGFREGFAKVELNDKWNYINKEGQFLSNQWFDIVYDFREGFASVYLNDKYNYIDKEGQVLSNQWFDWVNDFSDGFASVKLNNKWNYINREGQLLSNQWFDYANGFMDGFASVYLNKKWYKINQKGEIVESKNRNKKTIIITEKQKKKLKKAITPQEQVGKKVNAGVMDAVVGGMCENAEDDKFVLGAEMNAPIGGVYYHVKESKLNESPDVVEYFNDNFTSEDAYPFVCLLNSQQIYIGKGGQKHADLIREIDPSLVNKFMDNSYEDTCEVTLTGRYWKNHNVISFWKTPVNKRLNIRKVIDQFKQEGIINSSEYTLIDYWDNPNYSLFVFPIKWLFNGTYDMFAGKCSRIAPIKSNEYIKTGKYTYFEVTTHSSGVQCVSTSGNEILTALQYYMKTSSMNEGVEDRNRMVDIRRIVQTDNFKRWFGNSKIVDENGFPIIVHHGSPKFEGDSFKKDKNGKSLNYGEQGVFCTTQDMSWAKRFSYPISPGSTSFTVKVDYSKPGDILSGFLKIEHPLDFFHLSDKDWKNIKDIVLNSYMAETMSDEKFEELKYAVLIKNHQFLKHMISGYNKDNNFGNVLKKYGYDGYIALMDMKDTAIEYCFFEPNQFKSIYSIAFNPENNSIYEGRNKVVKNDKGEIVPEKCDKCGGKVVLQIHGEPVYVCKDCGKYFGTMPFTLKEEKLNESFEDLEDFLEEYSVVDLLSEFVYDKKHNIKQKRWNLIPAEQYHNLLKRYMNEPTMARIPYNVVHNWFANIIVPNAFTIEYITNLAGHSGYFPSDEVSEFFNNYDIVDYHTGSEYLYSIGFYDWCKLPDGSDGWSDYGLQPLFKNITEYTPNMSAEDLLILINRCLDVAHQRGDLSSAFIQGGKKSCDYISNSIHESIDYSKWLQQLKKRRDPDNIEENIETEAKWNGQGQEWHNLIKPNEIPPILYHSSYKKNRTNILKNGIIASVGEEYEDWWNFAGPNDEEPDDEDLPELVFLTDKPYRWSNNYYLDIMDIYQVDMSKLDSNLLFLDPTDNLSGSYCYEGNIPRNAIKLIDTRQYSKSIKENVENEITSDEVDLSSFNLKKKLNPDFWIDGHLDSRIRMKLLDIADDFIETLNIDKVKPVDIIMTGSLANFNWSKKYSDIDLHIVYDFNDIDEHTEFIKEYFDSKKQLWNQKHKDLNIYGFNVELYVQDANEPHASSGVYSLDRDTWIVEPDRNVLATSKVNKEYIKDRASYYATKIDELCYQFKKAKDDEYKIRKIYEKSEKLFDEIKSLRKIGFKKYDGKELNNQNIIFKFLRRKNYLEKLSNLRTKCYDKLNGI